MHFEQFALDQIGVRRGPKPDRAFGFELQKIVFAIIEQHLQRVFGIGVGEMRQARRKPGRAERDRRCDLEIADDLFARVFQRRFRDHRGARHFAGELAQRHAWAGEQQAARVALKQRHAHAVFQRGDLAADGGLADPELFGRRREASGLGGVVEGFKFVPVHQWSSAPNSHAMQSR